MQRGGFLGNVLWSWAGIGVALLSAFILSPVILGKLGDDDYGLWSVTTALVEYYWLLDFGLRSATVRFTAHYNASGETGRINTMLSTAMVYNICLLPVLIGGTWLGRDKLAAWARIQNPLFPELLFAVATAWALTSLLSTFTATLEGLQRFGSIQKTSVFCTLLRMGGILYFLNRGGGVLLVAYITVGAQVLLHLVNYLHLRRVFPALNLRLASARMQTLREMLRYGSHSVLSSLGQRVLSQSPPLLIAYFLPERYAGYFVNPRQLLDYTVEGVARIGNVSNARAAEWVATNRMQELRAFSLSVNRLSLAVFLPVSIFLGVYGKAFLLQWLKRPDFVEQAFPVLLALLGGHTLANAGQYNSSSILFGMARHRTYARTMAAEAVLLVAGAWFLIPHYGVTAMAAWMSLLLFLNRAMLTPWLLTRELGIGFWAFLGGVNRPLLAVPPVVAGLLLLRTVIPGVGWTQLIEAGVVTVLFYAPLAYVLLPAEDRELLLDKLRPLLRRFRTASTP